MNSNFTQVPNFVFDCCISNLKESEIKLLLVIIRQTLGWRDKRTGQRKIRDRITNTQFQIRSGLSKRIVTKALQTLIAKGLISITDFNGLNLHSPSDRKGKNYMFYAVHKDALSNAQRLPKPVQKQNHNKRNMEKEKGTKARIGEMTAVKDIIGVFHTRVIGN